MPEPLVLINLFTMPPEHADAFVAGWPASTAPLAVAPGFRGTRLHRAVSLDTPHQIVNVAQWDSVEEWQSAMTAFAPRAERLHQARVHDIQARPAFYRVVSVTPDPRPGATTEGGAR